MTLSTALNIAAAIHTSFSTDAGAAAYLSTEAGDWQVETRRFLEAHPARYSGRPAIRSSIADAIETLRTVERMQAA